MGWNAATMFLSVGQFGVERHFKYVVVDLESTWTMIFYFLLVSCYCQFRQTESQQLSVRPMKLPDGSSMCALDKPFKSTRVADVAGFPPGVPGPVLCTYRCTEMSRDDGCIGFNYVEDEFGARCQFHNTISTTFDCHPSCTYYQVRRSLGHKLFRSYAFFFIMASHRNPWADSCT